MSQWWRPGRSDSAVPVQQHVVGNALVLHLLPKISPEAQSIGLEVPADPDHDIVVLDLGAPPARPGTGLGVQALPGAGLGTRGTERTGVATDVDSRSG